MLKRLTDRPEFDVSLGRGPRRVELSAQPATDTLSGTVGSTAASGCGSKRSRNGKEPQQ